MATSSSYDFSMNRDDIIKAALRLTGYTKQGDNPPDNVVTDCAEALNIMIKALQAEGIGLWLNKIVTLFLQYDTEAHNIGPSGDHATELYADTQTSVAAESGDTTITVDSTTDITSNYNIGVELDGGTLQWTTVSGSPANNVVTLAAELTDDVAVDNMVYCYQTKTQRPLQILHASIRNYDGMETPIKIVSRNAYLDITDKSTSATPILIYYDPQLTDGVIYPWPTSNDVGNVLRMSIKRPIQDFDIAADDADFPVECSEFLKFNLALRLAPELMDDIAEDRMKYIVKMAAESKQQMLGFDAEHGTSIYMIPEVR